MFPIYQSIYKTSPHEGNYLNKSISKMISFLYYGFKTNYLFLYYLNDIDLGGPDNGFPDIASHSLALQFLSNNIGSKSNHPFVSSPQFIQHINRSNHPITNTKVGERH